MKPKLTLVYTGKFKDYTEEWCIKCKLCPKMHYWNGENCKHYRRFPEDLINRRNFLNALGNSGL